ncbi:GNAT family protein [Saccharopolyspora sp. TS4A08]|uniref:GNAT family protein n=1 Tax=Saccharopolyspora ipomoeae TaxID=3042027 RepID=A0ABT6PJU9_9PSEU|nr:GNAT family protein [Saccharopolyspora sp. TS4A08]MDI2028265.1 GNAT family protein [Saccharopolyspora sp. TS4A08]
MVELIGESVRLREFRASDVDASLLVVGDDRVTRFLSFDSRSREQAEAMIAGTVERAAVEPRTEFYLAVTPKDGDDLVGFARLGLTGVKADKLGYATDAARTILNHAFGSLGLHRVTAAIGPDNTASLAVVRKLGFIREGTLRDHVFTNGAWRDSHLHSVLSPEWNTRDHL